MRTQRGSIVAATWLIGLGLVFLLRQAFQLDWSEAWPLFVILAGVAGVVGRAIRGVHGIAGVWSFTWPVVCIAIGAILLLSTTRTLGREPIDVLADGWPWLLVGIGVWFLIGAVLPFGRPPIEELAVPLAGATDAAVNIRFGAGDLTVGPAGAGHLVDGRFTGGVIQHGHGLGRIDLEQDTTYGLPWFEGPADWSVGLVTEVPLDLRLDTGAARAQVDLSEFRLRRLELHTGASDTRIRLPRAAGMSTVTAETGAAALVVEVPTDVAARIRTRMAIGSSDIDQTRFPRSTDGYESPGFATAPNRVDLDLRGGVGSFRVVGVA